MTAQVSTRPEAVSDALAAYLARNPKLAIRIAGMRPEDAAAVLRRTERWMQQQKQEKPR